MVTYHTHPDGALADLMSAGRKPRYTWEEKMPTARLTCGQVSGGDGIRRKTEHGEQASKPPPGFCCSFCSQVLALSFCPDSGSDDGSVTREL